MSLENSNNNNNELRAIPFILFKNGQGFVFTEEA